MKEPTMPSPEEIAKIRKERTINDAELLKKGAVYDEKGELAPTKNQTEDMAQQHEREMEQERIAKLVEKIESMGLKLDKSQKLKIRFKEYLERDVVGMPFSGYSNARIVSRFLNENREGIFYIGRYSTISVTGYAEGYKDVDMDEANRYYGGAFEWEDIEAIKKVEN